MPHTYMTNNYCKWKW